MKYQLKDVLGWQNANGEVLCWECFAGNSEDVGPGWFPILEQDVEENIFLCDGEDCHCLI